MLSQLADYVVLELILGEKIVEYISSEIHIMLYVITVAYFVHAVLRYRQNKKLLLVQERAQ